MNPLIYISFTLFMLHADYRLVSASPTTIDLFWNKSNHQFRLDREEGYELSLSLADRLNFYCPHYEGNEAKDDEYYKIYRVPEENYYSCSLPHGISETAFPSVGISRVTSCTNPRTRNMFSVVIERFSPLPGSHGGLAFTPGQTYYFISVSDGTREGINNRGPINSSCKSDNLRMKLKVAPLSGHHPRWSATSPARKTTPPTNIGKLKEETSTPFTKTASVTEGTTGYSRPKAPQAIIDAQVRLDSSCGTLSSSLITMVISLMVYNTLTYSLNW